MMNLFFVECKKKMGVKQVQAIALSLEHKTSPARMLQTYGLSFFGVCPPTGWFQRKPKGKPPLWGPLLKETAHPCESCSRCLLLGLRRPSDVPCFATRCKQRLPLFWNPWSRNSPRPFRRLWIYQIDGFKHVLRRFIAGPRFEVCKTWQNYSPPCKKCSAKIR